MLEALEALEGGISHCAIIFRPIMGHFHRARAVSGFQAFQAFHGR